MTVLEKIAYRLINPNVVKYSLMAVTKNMEQKLMTFDNKIPRIVRIHICDTDTN